MLSLTGVTGSEDTAIRCSQTPVLHRNACRNIQNGFSQVKDPGWCPAPRAPWDLEEGQTAEAYTTANRKAVYCQGDSHQVSHDAGSDAHTLKGSPPSTQRLGCSPDIQPRTILYLPKPHCSDPYSPQAHQKLRGTRSCLASWLRSQADP